MKGMIPFREAKRQFEREYVESVLLLTNGNVKKAAKAAEKDRKDFYELMKRTGIDPNDYRPEWSTLRRTE